MRTEQLIYLLAADDTRPRSIAPRVLGLGGGGLLIAAVAALLTLGTRGDLARAMSELVTAMKWVLPLSVAIPALIAALAFARPVTQRSPTMWIAISTAIIAGLWLLALIISTPAAQLWPEMRGNSLFVCLISVTAISALPLAAGLWVLRDGASNSPGFSGACVGLAVGGFSTAIYALHCDEDEPLFFLVWYSLAMMIVAAAGAIAGRKMLRW